MLYFALSNQIGNLFDMNFYSVLIPCHQGICKYTIHLHLVQDNPLFC